MFWKSVIADHTSCWEISRKMFKSYLLTNLRQGVSRLPLFETCIFWLYKIFSNINISLTMIVTGKIWNEEFILAIFFIEKFLLVFAKCTLYSSRVKYATTSIGGIRYFWHSVTYSNKILVWIIDMCDLKFCVFDVVDWTVFEI